MGVFGRGWTVCVWRIWGVEGCVCVLRPIIRGFLADSAEESVNSGIESTADSVIVGRLPLSTCLIF